MLKNIPLQIEKLNENIDKMKKILQDSNLYTQNTDTFNSVANALANPKYPWYTRITMVIAFYERIITIIF